MFLKIRPLSAIFRSSIALIFVAIHPAWAIDLMQVYQLALVQDSTLKAAVAANVSAQERVPQAMSQLLPNVSFSAGLNANDLTRMQSGSDTQSDRYNSNNQTLGIRQTIFRRPLSLGLTQAGFLARDAQAVLDTETQNLGVRVTGAYLEALLAKDQLDLVIVQIAAISTQLDAAKKSLAQGAGVRTDVDEAQARLDLALAQELEARQQVELTRRQVEVLINRPYDQLQALDAQRMVLTRPSQSLEAWVQLAYERSPEIQALKARLEAARLEIDKSRAGHLPTLDALAQVVRSGSENVNFPSSSYTNRVIGVQLTVPIYAGGVVNSTVRQATAEATRAEELLEAAKRDLSVRIHREYRGVTEGILKVQGLETAVRSAEQLVESSKRSYVGGTRTILDVFNAQQQRQTAKRDLATARYTYMISIVRLNALSGGDKTEALVKLNSWLAQPFQFVSFKL
jgi:outer membrane protein/protease secretion system outer membrane protein